MNENDNSGKAVFKMEDDDRGKRGCALVTGAARGIGRACALALAEQGFDIVVNHTSESSREAAEALAADIRGAYGVDALVIRCDVSSFDDVRKMMDEACDRFGFVEVLVNNAGINHDGMLMRMKEEAFDEVIAADLKGPFNCIRHAVPRMARHHRGRIVNLSSVAGIIGNPGQANYSAAKAGLIGLTKTVAREFAGRNITCNAVAPGFIETDMTRNMNQEALESMLSTVPLGRMGKPEDIAAMVAFLASDKAGYITGQVFQVDGGMAI